LLKTIAQKLPEPAHLNEAVQAKTNTLVSIVTFKGDKNHFQDLWGWNALLLQELQALSSRKWLDLAKRWVAPIGINVRCGNDFKTAQSESDFFTKGAIKTPLKWYVETLKFVRQVCGFCVPAVVVSDGTREQLRQLLEMPNVSFARPGCAISDLLILAHCRFLIGTGGSSFSAWGAFLSKAPTVTHPGQSLSWFRVRANTDQYFGEFDPFTGPPPQLPEAIRSSLVRAV